MKTLFLWILEHWQALLCVTFIGAAFFYAKENYAEVLIFLGLPIIMVFVYLASMVLNGKDNDSQDRKDDWLTRVGSIWLRLTMSRKNKHPGKQTKH